MTRRWILASAVFAALILALWFAWERTDLLAARDTGGPPLYANAEVAAADSAAAEPAPIDYDRYAALTLPPLPPERALQTFELEPGFRIELVAHEPDIIDPVAMDIDRDGRLWVVEMSSYMPVHDRTMEETSELERVPAGRIVVLEDTDQDGRMDSRRVFMDQLVLPRAVKVMDDGVLVAEPPNVWFITDADGDGIGDGKELVFDRYGNVADYNVEHMPNGLMWGMDNWIHSSESAGVSFRRVDGKWATRPFEQIGQWGLTQNDWGQPYSSHNSRTLTTHFTPYGYSERHPLFAPGEGIYSNAAESETMWPAHPTGINRGYQQPMIREDGTLRRSTAAAGAMIYRGDQFGEEYRGNAFVAEPAGNLIKRLVGIDDSPEEIEVTARFAYEGREFLTSTDERFRPVNLYNGPDGSIYVLDMYRGILQHARYLTDFLRDYAVAHDLHEPTGMGQFGRIYRIVREDRPIDRNTPRLSELGPVGLAGYLANPNGQLRDAAQQLLVQRAPRRAVRALERHARDGSAEFYTRLQALWTLEGYPPGVYKPSRLAELAMETLDDEHPRVRAAAIRILEPEVARGNADVLRRLERMLDEETAAYTRLQLLASLGAATDGSTLPWIARLLHENADNPYFREMALTGVAGHEQTLVEALRDDHGWRSGADEERDGILAQLTTAIAESSGGGLQLTGEELRRYTQGAQSFATCAACHGEQGRGLEGVAPPLAGSEWALSEPEVVVRILLHGLRSESSTPTDGAVDGGAAQTDGVMPAHGFLGDDELAAILTYVRQSWGNDAPPIAEEEVASIRSATQGRETEWTRDELSALR